MNDKQVERFMQGINVCQRLEILGGFEVGLTDEQVAFYAKPEFDWKQMTQIRGGFQDGLTTEQVAIYAKPEFDCEQMRQIRNTLKNSLTKGVTV